MSLLWSEQSLLVYDPQSRIVYDGQFAFVTIYKLGKFGIKAHVPNAKSKKNKLQITFFYTVVETKTELRNVYSELWGGNVQMLNQCLAILPFFLSELQKNKVRIMRDRVANDLFIFTLSKKKIRIATCKREKLTNSKFISCSSDFFFENCKKQSPNCEIWS